MKNKVLDKTNFADPNFANNKGEPIHRWVPWIAGFSKDFVDDIIQKNIEEQKTILDPFAGVGTTLVEAVRNGHNTVGFEINPYAALASRVKTHAYLQSTKFLENEKQKLNDFFLKVNSNGYLPKSSVPSGFITRQVFYSPAVLRKVLIIQDFIKNISNPRSREIFQLAFASTMVKYSNYSYEPSLGTRKGAGKSDIEDFDVLSIINEKLEEIIVDTKLSAGFKISRNLKINIYNSSFFECEKYIKPESIDLAITSPPYLNNYHYIRNTRPHLYWLGFAKEPKDTKKLEHQNYGKYWQTVRDIIKVSLEFTAPPMELIKKIEELRETNTDRGVYGGNGWANYASSYFNDTYKFGESLFYALKKGSSAFIVIGNSILQGIMIPTDVFLGQILEKTGLKVIDIKIPRKTRVGNSIINSSIRSSNGNKKNKLYEAVVEVKK